MDLERIVGTLITDAGPKSFVLHTQTGLLELDAFAEPEEAQVDLSVIQQQRFVQLIAERTDISFAKVRLGQYYDPKRDRWVDVFSEDEEDKADIARLKRGAPLSTPPSEPEEQEPSEPEAAAMPTPSETTETAPAAVEEPDVDDAEPAALEEPDVETIQPAVAEAETPEAPEAAVDAVGEAPEEEPIEIEILPEAPANESVEIEIVPEAPADESVEIEIVPEASAAEAIEMEIVPEAPAEEPTDIETVSEPEAFVEADAEDVVAPAEEEPAAEKEPPPDLDDPDEIEDTVEPRISEEGMVIDAVLLPSETVMLEKAIRIAVEAHGGQFDKAGKPYILHPLRMMLRMNTITEMMAAVLHDVVEDTGWTLEALHFEGFSDEVIEAVDGLTRREEETYAEFIERAAHHPVSRAVKLVDIEDNMDIRRLDTLTDKDKSRLVRYLKAWQWLTNDRKSDDFL